MFAKAVRTGQFSIMLVLYFLLGIAKMPETVNEGINDLVLHATGYCIAVFSAYLLVQRMYKMWLLLTLLWAFSLVVELVQHALPWRSFSVLDLMANGSGLLLGFLLVSASQPLLDRLIGWFRLNAASAVVER